MSSDKEVHKIVQYIFERTVLSETPVVKIPPPPVSHFCRLRAFNIFQFAGICTLYEVPNLILLIIF